MAPENQQTWRNHYLPQAYLTHFCNDSGEVLRTFLGPDRQLHERRFPPRSTGFEPDLYSVSDEGLSIGGGVRDKEVFEREVFGPIDNDGIRAVRKVMRTGPSELGNAEKRHFALLVNSFLERHPQVLRERDKEAVEMGRQVIQNLKKVWGPPSDGRPDVLDMINAEGLSKNMLRKHMVDCIRDERTLDFLQGLTFIMAKVEDNPVLRFVTGDVPVLINLGKPWPLNWFTLALDPLTLLIGHRFSESDFDNDTLIRLSMAHNVQLFQQCEYVFSRDPLEDNPIIKTRKAAYMFLRPVPWPNTGKRNVASKTAGPQGSDTPRNLDNLRPTSSSESFSE